MDVVVLAIAQDGDNRWVATLTLDGEPVRLAARFLPEGVSPDLMLDQASRLFAEFEASKEEKEVLLLVSRVRDGAEVALPHTIDVSDRWPMWRSAGPR